MTSLKRLASLLIFILMYALNLLVPISWLILITVTMTVALLAFLR
jgi:hypothetical protein